MACSFTFLLSEACNVTIATKGQVQIKKHASLSEPIKGLVLLPLTPSSPGTTFDIAVPSSTPGDNQDGIATSADSTQALSSACLLGGSKAPAVASPHTHHPSLTLFHLFPNSHLLQKYFISVDQRFL